ncbi:hypothetical protein ASZ90_018769 [hydrocarbon metagenome]|uniref:Uncharacterized protein n=1 Tax=hydrocarbon metagenome TaxID=938273 RepID=A0A0W8E5B5_9ZZZZ
MPKKNEFKIVLFIIAFVITFSLGLGAYYLYSRYNVEKPLLTQIDKLSSVEESVMEKQDSIYRISVTLGRVENVQEIYKQLDGIAAHKLGKGQYQIIINTQNNTIMDRVHYDIQPIVYEALANNQYVWMRDEIGRIAKQEQLEYKMFIDDYRVYLQFRDGDDYQYYIIDRNGSKHEAA